MKILLIVFLNLLLLQTVQANSSPKEQIKGLIDRQNTAWINQDDGTPQFTMDNVNQFPGLFAGVVINTSWAALQPTPTGELDLSTINGPLQQIADYNKQHPDRPLAVKLRVWAGANAPKWAKSLEGTPITIYRNPIPTTCTGAPTCPLTVGRFWNINGEYVKAWRALQIQLAALYDKEPLIRQVAVTSCTQQTDEPFVPTKDGTSIHNLNAAGYNDEAQKTCLKNAASIDYAPWKKTLIDFSFNPFTYMDQRSQDLTVTTDIMKQCISTLKQRCIVDTQAIGKANQGIDTPILAAIKTYASFVNLQTAAPIAMGNDPQQPLNMAIWNNTFSIAHQLGTKGLEVWSEAIYDGFDKMSMAQACSLLEILTPGETPSVCYSSLPNRLERPSNITGISSTTG